MSHPNLFTDEVVRKAFMFSRRGLNCREISERLGETMETPPKPDLILRWLQQCSKQAVRVALEGPAA